MKRIPTIKQIIIRITTIIAIVEFVIMFVFLNLHIDFKPYVEAIMDVLILVIISTPVIYIWIIKPYVVAHDKAIYQISHMAYHDSLTQLANRRLLSGYLDKLMCMTVRHELHGAVLLIDLDDFKHINDTHGHDAGDAVLIEVANRLKSFVRAEDIISRLGGDEFIVVLGMLDVDEQTANKKTLQIAKRIHKSLSETIKFKNISLHIGSSIGIRFLTPGCTNVDTVLKEADTAMYKAKRAGKGTIVVFNK